VHCDVKKNLQHKEKKKKKEKRDGIIL
jgi:hypothetical protein